MAERVRVREITNDEGNRLLRMVRRSSGSVVTWRRAQMVLLSAQGMDTAQPRRQQDQQMVPSAAWVNCPPCEECRGVLWQQPHLL